MWKTCPAGCGALRLASLGCGALRLASLGCGALRLASLGCGAAYKISLQYCTLSSNTMSSHTLPLTEKVA